MSSGVEFRDADVTRLQESKRAADDLDGRAGRRVLRESGEVQQDGCAVDAIGAAADQALRDVE